jgi:hypothetical protein
MGGGFSISDRLAISDSLPKSDSLAMSRGLGIRGSVRFLRQKRVEHFGFGGGAQLFAGCLIAQEP